MGTYAFFEKKISFILCVLGSTLCHGAFFCATYYFVQHNKAVEDMSLPKGSHLSYEVSFASFPVEEKSSVVKKDQQDSALAVVDHSFKRRKETISGRQSQSWSKASASSLPVSVWDETKVIPAPENAFPLYPQSEEEQGSEAICIMRVQIHRNGHVMDVDVVNGCQNCTPAFKEAAKKALMRWRFLETKGMIRTSFNKIIPIHFKMDDKN